MKKTRMPQRLLSLVLVLMLALWWRLSLPPQGVVLALCAGALAIALAVIALVSVSTAQRGIRRIE